MERGQTDVGYFLFVENEALFRRGGIGLRDIAGAHRGCECASRQGKAESGNSQCSHSGGFGRALLLRALLRPWHDKTSVSCCVQLDVESLLVRLKYEPAHSVPNCARLFEGVFSQSAGRLWG